MDLQALNGMLTKAELYLRKLKEQMVAEAEEAGVDEACEGCDDDEAEMDDEEEDDEEEDDEAEGDYEDDEE